MERINFNVTGETMIFRNEYKDKTFFKLGMSKKQQDGTYENGYVDVRFAKKLPLPENKTKINIKQGWWTFWNRVDSEGKNRGTQIYIFVNDYEPTRAEESPADSFAAIDEDVPF